jgi:hypothetical protein
MAKTLMPIGIPMAFEGDIRLIDPKAYGYFFCEITCPDDIKNPILQRRVETSDGVRTIAGTGTWQGWIYSKEMDNAILNGYSFNIIKGYEFKKGDIFSGYVETMYNLRLQYSSEDPMIYIAKLLLNSLYGKFGMKLTTTKVEIFNLNFDEDLSLFTDLLTNLGPTIQDWVKIDDYVLIVRDDVNISDIDKDNYHGVDVNVAISAAITAGGRMWMSQFKNNPTYRIFYSDTDSILIDKALHPDLVGSALGQLKLEHIISRAVFLAPKTYGFITNDGKEIIKVKGVKSENLKDFHISDLEALLINDTSKEFNQDKWYKKMFEGQITIQDVAYTLKVTSNKRQTIYINNIFEYTKPYNYDDVIKK